MRIGNIDTEKQVLIIAEIGNNHEGDFQLAQRMIREAAQAGADAVKFQTFVTEDFISSSQKDRFAKLKKFELSYDEFKELSVLANELGVIFLSTPFDLKSAEFLNSIVPAFKIASGDNNFYPLIQKTLSFGKPLIISTGLSDIAHIKNILEFARKNHTGQIPEVAFLHCNCAYPVEDSQVNLASIACIREQTEAEVGYSDHSLGIQAAVLAVAAGARIIEKHFTIDKNYSDFRDHQLSADPDEMKTLVEQTRKAELLMGTKNKIIQPCEKNCLPAARRSIAAARDLNKGHQITMDDITWLRPGTGIAPGQEESVVGRVLTKDTVQGRIIEKDDLATDI